LFLNKKDEKLCMCIDYHALNKITIKKNYPLPQIDNIFDHLNGAFYFSRINLKSSYYLICVEKENVEKMVMKTRYNSYKLLVMPFGLCNTPSIFTMLMNSIFHNKLDEFMIIYIDDILVYSKFAKEHATHLEFMLQKLKENKLYANRAKNEFASSKMDFLAHVLFQEGVRPNPKKIESIKEWKILMSTKGVKSFLGLANFCKKFLKNFSALAKPLTNLLKKKGSFEWKGEQQKVFDLLKMKLLSTLMLQFLNFKKPFEVHNNANGFTIGKVLMQEKHPIAFESKKLARA